MRSSRLTPWAFALTSGILLPGLAAAMGPADAFPARAFAVDGGVISVRGGVMRDPSRPKGPGAKLRYPSAHFIVMTNETAAPFWAEVEMKPPEEKVKPVFWGPLPVGQEGIWKWSTYDAVWAQPIPVRISVYTDKGRKMKIGEKSMTMYIGEELKDLFHEQPKSEGGRVSAVAISGWREMSQSLCSNKETAANEELRWDVCRALWKQESLEHLDCEHPILAVERLDATKSALVPNLPGDARGSIDNLLSRGDLIIEKWIVKSCETTTPYEVMLFRNPQGGTDIMAAPMSP